MSDDMGTPKPRGPNALADDCRATLAALDAQIAASATKRERKALRQRRKLVRDVESWCRTRAGYVLPQRVKE